MQEERKERGAQGEVCENVKDTMRVRTGYMWEREIEIACRGILKSLLKRGSEKKSSSRAGPVFLWRLAHSAETRLHLTERVPERERGGAAEAKEEQAQLHPFILLSNYRPMVSFPPLSSPLTPPGTG
ncbi:hypothetical protein MHYP_G00076800 [Metynnis hypsauchen]